MRSSIRQGEFWLGAKGWEHGAKTHPRCPNRQFLTFDIQKVGFSENLDLLNYLG